MLGGSAGYSVGILLTSSRSFIAADFLPAISLSSLDNSFNLLPDPSIYSLISFISLCAVSMPIVSFIFFASIYAVFAHPSLIDAVCWPNDIL